MPISFLMPFDGTSAVIPTLLVQTNACKKHPDTGDKGSVTYAKKIYAKKIGSWLQNNPGQKCHLLQKFNQHVLTELYTWVTIGPPFNYHYISAGTHSFIQLTYYKKSEWERTPLPAFSTVRSDDVLYYYIYIYLQIKMALYMSFSFDHSSWHQDTAAELRAMGKLRTQKKIPVHSAVASAACVYQQS